MSDKLITICRECKYFYNAGYQGSRLAEYNQRCSVLDEEGSLDFVTGNIRLKGGRDPYSVNQGDCEFFQRANWFMRFIKRL